MLDSETWQKTLNRIIKGIFTIQHVMVKDALQHHFYSIGVFRYFQRISCFKGVLRRTGINVIIDNKFQTLNLEGFRLERESLKCSSS